MNISFRVIKSLILSIALFVGLNGQWQPKQGNLPTVQFGVKIDAVNSLHAVVAISPGGIYRTLDGGDHWTLISTSTPMDLSMVDSAHIWFATQSGEIYATSNGGEQWVRQYRDSTKVSFMNYVKMFSLSEGVAMGDAMNESLPAVILRTTDGGSNWISVNDSSFGGYTGDLWRRVDFVSPSIGYFVPYGVGTSSVWKTTDGGTTWHNLNLTGSHQVLRFYDENIGIVCFGNYPGNYKTFRRTRNGGLLWESFTPEISMQWGNDFCFCIDNPALIWFTDNTKLYFSADTGRTWTEQYTIKGRDIVFANKQVGWVLGDNMLIKTTEEGITSIRPDGNTPPIPSKSTLYQNYPNPFNPMTTIQYDVPSTGFVELIVYDVVGREIQILTQNVQKEGSYSVKFNGAELPNGIYFYTLRTNSAKIGRKMVLLK